MPDKKTAEPRPASGAAPEPILAAGGIVAASAGGKIVVVHRRRYHGEVGLPKGKVKVNDGESIVRAAEREVHEETGCRVRVTGFAGLTHYLVGEQPKVVFYYHMQVISEGGAIDAGEIERVAWVTPQEAAASLTHPEDRELVTRIFALPATR
jgi:8-oxo-dGTP pyrophosphatase MutT (NUDIX family)